MSFEETFLLGKSINCHTIKFQICPDLWSDSDAISNEFDQKDIHEIKYLNEEGTAFSEEVGKIPTNGGVYFFIVKAKTLPELANYLVYIGRAKKTDGHNLRIRCKRYFQNYKNEKERPKIARMIKQYGKFLYLRYVDLGDNNERIDLIESKLINNLTPPFNDQIPKKKIRDAIKAFA